MHENELINIVNDIAITVFTIQDTALDEWLNNYYSIGRKDKIFITNVENNNIRLQIVSGKELTNDIQKRINQKVREIECIMNGCD